MSILRHELQQVFKNAKTWYSFALIQILLAVMFNWLLNNFLKGQAISSALHFGITEEVIHPFYAWFALLVLMFLPSVSAQMICGEKQRGTIFNYYCAPISSMQFIFAKFLSLNILITLMLAFISLMPLCIAFSGSIDYGQLFATLLGVYLLLSAASAVSLCVSMFTNNVLRANLIIFLSIAAFILIEWGAQYFGATGLFLQSFGLLKPLKDFLAGIINLRGLSYYASIIVGFMWMGCLGYKRKVSI